MSSFVATEKKNIETPSWNLDASFGYFSDLTSPVDIYSILFIRSPRSLHTWTSRSMLPDYPSASSKLPKVNSSQI